jgi:hemoglobin
MSRRSAPPSPDEVDLLFPPSPPPAATLLGQAGESALRGLVRHHHVLLRRSSIGDLFPRDQKRFDAVVEHIAEFVINSVNGHPEGQDSRGLIWFRSRHLPLTIDETARNVWLGALLASFDDVDFPEPAREVFWNWVEALSIRAITRRTMVGQPRRYPLADAAEALRPFVESARRSA